MFNRVVSLIGVAGTRGVAGIAVAFGEAGAATAAGSSNDAGWLSDFFERPRLPPGVDTVLIDSSAGASSAWALGVRGRLRLLPALGDLLTEISAMATWARVAALR